MEQGKDKNLRKILLKCAKKGGISNFSSNKINLEMQSIAFILNKK